VIGGQWQGIDEACAILERITAETVRADVASAAMLTVSRGVAETIAVGLPRREPAPDMADSITAARVDTDVEPGVAVVEIGPRRSHPHAFLVKFWEFGTSKLAALGIMRSVWDETEPRFWRQVFAQMRPAYERAARRHARATSAGAKA
jgi:hypothetical protein